MMKQHYLATPEDGKDILRILESSPAQGSIELLYTRRPDAYESYRKEYGEARVFVSKKESRITGTCAELIRDVYIGGEPTKAAYVCGMKKDIDYRHVGFELNFIRALQRDDINFYYCSIVADNTRVQRILEKKSRRMEMRMIGEYTTYILSPRGRWKVTKKNYVFRRATKVDQQVLLEFLNTEGRKRDLFPVINSFEQFHNLTCEDFYILMDGECIVAAAALWNQTEYKQYVVTKYRGVMRCARLLNPLLSLLGYMKLPKENQAIDFPMLSFFVSRDDNEEYVQCFLSEINKEIRKCYDMFAIGLPKNHRWAMSMRKMSGVHFDTKLYEIRFPWSAQAYCEVEGNRLFPECGML